jgi:hypothetical protein
MKGLRRSSGPTRAGRKRGLAFRDIDVMWLRKVGGGFAQLRTATVGMWDRIQRFRKYLGSRVFNLLRS